MKYTLSNGQTMARASIKEYLQLWGCGKLSNWGGGVDCGSVLVVWLVRFLLGERLIGLTGNGSSVPAKRETKLAFREVPVPAVQDGALCWGSNGPRRPISVRCAVFQPFNPWWYCTLVYWYGGCSVTVP